MVGTRSDRSSKRGALPELPRCARKQLAQCGSEAPVVLDPVVSLSRDAQQALGRGRPRKDRHLDAEAAEQLARVGIALAEPSSGAILNGNRRERSDGVGRARRLNAELLAQQRPRGERQAAVALAKTVQ